MTCSNDVAYRESSATSASWSAPAAFAIEPETPPSWLYAVLVRARARLSGVAHAA
jgi:hypothetical protein